MKDTPAEFMQTNSRSEPMTEGKKWESGIFDRQAEAEVLRDRPDLVAGKKAFEAALLAALDESEYAIDIVEAMRDLPAYGVFKSNGVSYIKTPGGESVSLIGYLNKLEKSLIEVYRKLADKNKELAVVTDQLQELLSKVKPKRQRKGKKK